MVEKNQYNKPMIVIVGPSASGKTFAALSLKKEFDISKVVTHTTRSPRKGEVTGVDYFFVTKENFDFLSKKGTFVETTYYSGNYYGCSKTEISDSKVVILDPSGLHAFQALGNPSIVFFALTATKKTRRERMKERGDDKEDIEKRLTDDDESFASSKLEGIDCKICTDHLTADEVAEKIYSSYLRILKKRNIKPNLLIAD